MRKVYLFTIVLSSIIFQSNAQWEAKSSIPEGRHHPVTLGFDDFGYVATGTNTTGAPTKDVYRYDPTTDMWNTLPDFPGDARSFAIGEEYNGKGYMGFGASSFSLLRDLWEFDPETETWTELAPCPCPGRRHPAFVALDGKIYMGLGDGSGGNYNDWWEYDIASDSWEQMPNLPGYQRHHPYQFEAGGQLYAGMGHGNFGIYKDWYRFNLQSKQWEPMNDFPDEARVAGSQFDFNGDGYVLSGDGDDHSWMQQGEFWKYNHASDTWEELPPHPGISKWAPGAFVIDRTAYFIAGQNRQTNVITDDVWAYTFEIPASTNHAQQDPIAVDVYPNPATDLIQINTEKSIAQIQLLDLTGRLILNERAVNKQINLSELPAGTYLMKVTFEDGSTANQPLIKQ